MISLIVAMSKNHVIGNGDKIPWHIPEDFKYFKKQTVGKPIIMGRSTYESIHGMKGTDPHAGLALPDRENIVVTSQSGYNVHATRLCHSLEQAIEIAKNHKGQDNEIMIIGGGQIYKQSMDIVDRMYITIIDKEYDGDVFFPKWSGDEWALTSSNPQDGYTFNIYDRKP